MKRIVLACLAGLLAATAVIAAPPSASMPAVWRYAHPNATALIGIEWNRIAGSPVGQQIRSKIGEAGLSGAEGFDVLDDVLRVFISSPGKPGGAESEQPPAVIALQGQFDLDEVRALAGAKMVEAGVYQSIPLFEEADAEGDDPMALALASSQTILLGNVGSVKAAIDHYQAADPAQSASPLFARAAELAAGNDVWIVSEASPEDFASSTDGTPSFLQDVESIEAGLSFRDGLGVELSLGAGSPESAQNLAGGLQFLLGMMLSGHESGPGASAITEKLRVMTDSTRVHLALHLSQAEFEDAFDDLESSLSFGAADRDVGVQAAVRGSGEWSWEQPPRQKQVVRIFGLEDGPREIPLGQ